MTEITDTIGGGAFASRRARGSSRRRQRRQPPEDLRFELELVDHQRLEEVRRVTREEADPADEAPLGRRASEHAVCTVRRAARQRTDREDERDRGERDARDADRHRRELDRRDALERRAQIVERAIGAGLAVDRFALDRASRRLLERFL